MFALLAKLIDLTADFIPPETRTPLWRILITTAMLIHLSWSCGWLPGMSGFAQTKDVQQIRADVTAMRSELIEGSILDRRFLHCSSEGSLRQLHLERLQLLLSQYRVITGLAYSLPPCAEVLGMVR